MHHKSKFLELYDHSTHHRPPAEEAGNIGRRRPTSSAARFSRRATLFVASRGKALMCFRRALDGVVVEPKPHGSWSPIGQAALGKGSATGNPSNKKPSPPKKTKKKPRHTRFVHKARTKGVECSKSRGAATLKSVLTVLL